MHFTWIPNSFRINLVNSNYHNTITLVTIETLFLRATLKSGEVTSEIYYIVHRL